MFSSCFWENARQEIDATGQIFILPDFPPKVSTDLHWLDSLPAQHRGFPQHHPQHHVQTVAEMTKTCVSGEKQPNKSLPDVCNTNLRNTELTGAADACVAFPSQAGETAKLVAEAGVWHFDAASCS